MNTSPFRNRSFLLLVTLIACGISASLAPAATITWGGPQNITGNTDVSTNGSLVGAFNVGNTGVFPTTVNGVNFQGFAVPSGSTGATVGNFAMFSGGTFESTNTQTGSTNAPFSTLSPEYRTLLAAATINRTPFTLAISGLIAGMQYEFQWWANYSQVNEALVPMHSATAGNTVTLDHNTSNTSGGRGQFAIGTFTADAATQSIIFSGPSHGLLNGFQLREISAAAAVPETGSTSALFALALGAFALVRRRAVAKR